MNKNLRNYFHRCRDKAGYLFDRKGNFYFIDQLFNQFCELEKVNWSVENAVILKKVKEPDKYPDLFDTEKEHLLNLMNNQVKGNANVELSDDDKVLRLIDYSSEVLKNRYYKMLTRKPKKPKQFITEIRETYFEWKLDNYSAPSDFKVL